MGVTAADVIAGTARWHLHRGDSLAWMATLPDGCVDAVITDPPYAIVSQSASVVKTIRFQAPELQFYEAWLREQLAQWSRVLKSTGAIWFTVDWHGALAFERACSDMGLNRPAVGIWDRGGLGMGYILRHTYECFVVAGMADFKRVHTNEPDVWRDDWGPGNRTTSHSAEKPISLMTRAIRLVCGTPGAVVLDPFAGSGTVGVSALRLGHRALLCEREQTAHDTIAARLTAENAGTDWRNPKQIGLFPEPTQCQ